MASIHLDKRTGNFNITFCYGGKTFHRSCRTKDESNANSTKALVEETLQLLEQGRIVVPDGAEPGRWIMTGGKITKRPNLVNADAERIGWDDAITKMKESMEANNLRASSIEAYEIAIRNLRKVFPSTNSPDDVTEPMAEEYKIKRSKQVQPTTVAGNINKLDVIWSKWFIRACKITSSNPFAKVDKPKLDKPDIRILNDGELSELYTWIEKRWDGWRLPLLFLETKSLIGCRIRELAYLRRTQLDEGRIVFESVTSKGRKSRRSKLPQKIFEELQRMSGTVFVFEKWTDELRSILSERGKKRSLAHMGEFKPERLVRWVQGEIDEFRNNHPEIKYFKLHNVRGTAMSKAKTNGVSYDEAAIAFGCHPETMRKHYVKLDETAISDSVMDRIQKNGDDTV